MSKIIKQDSNGVKPLLAVGEFGYDNYPAGGDVGRVYVGNGSENIPQAKKAEVVTVDGKVDTHVARIDNPHGVTKTQVGLSNVDNTADSAKVVASAGKWTTARTLSLTGGITGSVSIDGSGNASIVTTVAANSVALGTDTTGNYVAGTTAGAGVTVSGTPGEGWSPTIALTDVGTVGTYTKVTTNSKGQITVGGTLVAEDIPNLDTSKITTGTLPVDRGGTGVTTVTGTGSVVLNTSPALVTPNIGIAIGTSFNSITGLASVAPLVAGTAAVGTSTLTARQDHVHPVQTTISGNAGTATKLATARTINGVSFDGSANITVVDSTKAPLASPTFTGTPTAPTAAVGTSNTVIATTEFVNAEIANDAIPRVVSTDNAIVRFDGTTGAVQTSNITIDDSGNIGSGNQTFNGFGGSGFKNYIINGNFDIWQRGTSFNIAGGEVRCSDMFLAYNPATNPTASIDKGPIGSFSSLKISGANSTSTKFVIHRIEAVNFISLGRDGNTKVTFSFWLKADVASTVKVAIRIPNVTDFWGDYTNAKISNDIQITTDWARYSFTFNLDFVYWGGVALAIYTTTAQTSLWTSRWQLEQGSIATPFENRPYSLDLSLCNRYARDIGNSSLYGQIGNGFAISTTTALIEIDVNDMRIVPIISNTLTANLFEIEYANGAGTNRVTCTAIAINSSATANNNKLNLIITVGGGLTAGQCVGFRNNNTSTNKIILSAEL